MSLKTNIKDIEQIRKMIFDFDKASTNLEFERELLIRTKVFTDCLWIEESMSLIIMDFVLQDSPKWKSNKYFGRIKRFRLFYDDILTFISPFQKLSILKQVIKIPKDIDKTMCKIFNLRNKFSHVFTFDYTNIDDIQYNGACILELNTLENYIKDFNEVALFLHSKIKP